MQNTTATECNSQGISPEERTILRQLFDKNNDDAEAQLQLSDLILLQGVIK
jgi:hypothetical protein